jgi:hypothetical protein
MKLAAYIYFYDSTQIEKKSAQHFSNNFLDTYKFRPANWQVKLDLARD